MAGSSWQTISVMGKSSSAVLAVYQKPPPTCISVCERSASRKPVYEQAVLSNIRSAIWAAWLATCQDKDSAHS
jgi:hypothetical protein